jgi:hypothetical protein
MKTIIRSLAVVISPLLAFFLAGKFAQMQTSTAISSEAAKALAVASTGLIMLILEQIVSKGQKWSAQLRFLLDRRAQHEGFWLQSVYRGPEENAVAVFHFIYEPHQDSYKVEGKAYSSSGEEWARWNSTQVLFSSDRYTVTYLWEGQDRNSPNGEWDKKSGLSKLELTYFSFLSPQKVGKGTVELFKKDVPVDFETMRVTEKLLAEYHLSFGLSQLKDNTHMEWSKLAMAHLRTSSKIKSIDRSTPVIGG